MEQKGINASSQLTGSQYTVVTVANVLNHCSFFMHGSTGMWNNNSVGKAPRSESQQARGHRDKWPDFNDPND